MPRAVKILERIHTNVWGLAPTPSIGGMRDFATLSVTVPYTYIVQQATILSQLIIITLSSIELRS